jgi:hypothetical protein
MTKYKVEALQQVGLEGFWGLILTSSMLIFMQLIPCSQP